ncbi:MAG TPA: polysaccharide deacetylase family protein [Gammaproteobacteria bacterium]|nr:polysaccharide deacetylase family protein [Gammaproteobacteria bacterium]
MNSDIPDLFTVAGRYGLGLLFHACYPNPPRLLARGLHNITPAQLEDTLVRLKKYFQFVSIDEFAASECCRGLACVSFDDGYKSVFEQALPVLRALDIPATVFINSTMLDGGVFWRDRVRVLQNLGLVEDFEAFSAVVGGDPGCSFYRRSKHSVVNSAAVDMALQQFFAGRDIVHEGPAAVIDDVSWIQPIPGVTYGNHSHSHYVLSSLSKEEQYQEIDRCRARLRGLSGITCSEIFSIPFGETNDFNSTTLEIIAELGYRGIALSRHQLQGRPQQMAGLQVVERFMPRIDSTTSIQATLASMV